MQHSQCDTCHSAIGVVIVLVVVPCSPMFSIESLLHTPSLIDEVDPMISKSLLFTAIEYLHDSLQLIRWYQAQLSHYKQVGLECHSSRVQDIIDTLSTPSESMAISKRFQDLKEQDASISQYTRYLQKHRNTLDMPVVTMDPTSPSIVSIYPHMQTDKPSPSPQSPSPPKALPSKSILLLHEPYTLCPTHITEAKWTPTTSGAQAYTTPRQDMTIYDAPQIHFVHPTLIRPFIEAMLKKQESIRDTVKVVGVLGQYQVPYKPENVGISFHGNTVQVYWDGEVIVAHNWCFEYNEELLWAHDVLERLPRLSAVDNGLYEKLKALDMDRIVLLTSVEDGGLSKYVLAHNVYLSFKWDAKESVVVISNEQFKNSDPQHTIEGMLNGQVYLVVVNGEYKIKRIGKETSIKVHPETANVDMIKELIKRTGTEDINWVSNKIDAREYAFQRKVIVGQDHVNAPLVMPLGIEAVIDMFLESK